VTAVLQKKCIVYALLSGYVTGVISRLVTETQSLVFNGFVILNVVHFTVFPGFLTLSACKLLYTVFQQELS